MYNEFLVIYIGSFDTPSINNRNTNRYDYWQWLRQECRSLLRLVFRLYFVVLTHHPLYLSLTDGCMGMASCHTLLFTIYNQNHDKTYTSKP